MDDVGKEIEILKKELKEKEYNLNLAAHYGKTLLDQNAELNATLEATVQEYSHKIEGYQQDNYSLSMKLEAKERTISSLTDELDRQENSKREEIAKLKSVFEEEIAKPDRKILSLESTIEILQKEVAIHREKSDDLQTLLEDVQRSKHESTSPLMPKEDSEEYTTALENQISLLTVEKQELEKEVLELKSSLKASFLKLSRKDADLTSLQSEREEQECRFTSLFNENERTKTENLELKLEIDNIQLEATDPKKKGNSLFAELEDNRQALEKRLLSLTSRYSVVKKQCEIKTQEINKLKLHVASLLKMTTGEANVQYQQYLEQSLSSTQSQLRALTERCRNVEKELKLPEQVSHKNPEDGAEIYFKYLYEEARAKVSSLEEEVTASCFNSVCLNDQILELRRQLYLSEREVASNKSQIIRLSVRLDELGGREEQQENTPKEKKKVEVFIETLHPTNEENVKESKEEESKKTEIKEEFIRTETPQKISEEVKSEPLCLKKEKENEPPNVLPEEVKKKKGVQFSAGVASNDDEPSKKINATKPRRKMEAPLIKVAAATESEECKLQ